MSRLCSGGFFGFIAQHGVKRCVFLLLFLFFMLAFYLPLTSKQVNNIFYAGLALPCLIWLCRYPSALKTLFPFAWLLALIWALVILTAGDVRDVKVGLYLTLLFACCIQVQGEAENSSKVFITYSLFSLLIFFVALYNWAIGWVETGVIQRHSVFLGAEKHPIFFSLMLISSFITGWLFYAEPRLKKLDSKVVYSVSFLLFCVLALTCAIVFQSRTTLVGFVAFFIGYVFQRKAWLLGSGVFLLVSALAVALGWDEVLQNRGYSFRLVIWEDVWRRLTMDCGVWFGCGADGYVFLGEFPHPHNAYLSVLYQGGALAALGFLIFSVMFICRTWRSPWFLVALFGGASMLTETGGIFTSPKPLWVYFWIPIFMAVLDVRSDVVKSYFQARSTAKKGTE